MFRQVTQLVVAGIAVVTIGMLAETAHAGLLGSYEFGSQTLVPTDADASDGVTFSNLNTNSYPSLFDNGAGDFLRISGDDTENGTSIALDNARYISFTVTNSAAVSLVLSDLTLRRKATNVYSYSASTVFASPQGFDDTTGDAIGGVGRHGDGSDTAYVTETVDLTGGFSGSNPQVADFTISGGGSITFYLPWIDGSGSATRYMDVDDIQVSGALVPEPATLALFGLAALMVLARRGRAT